VRFLNRDAQDAQLKLDGPYNHFRIQVAFEKGACQNQKGRHDESDCDVNAFDRKAALFHARSAGCAGRLTLQDGVDPRLHTEWRTRVHRALEHLIQAPQPLDDELIECSALYRKLRSGEGATAGQHPRSGFPVGGRTARVACRHLSTPTAAAMSGYLAVHSSPLRVSSAAAPSRSARASGSRRT
jgi:hypothetical protein